MIDTTIPPIRLFAEADLGNNRTTKAYAGYWKKWFWHIGVGGNVPRDPTKTPAHAIVHYIPGGLYKVFPGTLGEDPQICFKRAMIYALGQLRPLKSDPPVCHDRWQNEILPAIAELQQQLELTHV
jgi:hypothetical protein